MNTPAQTFPGLRSRRLRRAGEIATASVLAAVVVGCNASTPGAGDRAEGSEPSAAEDPQSSAPTASAASAVALVEWTEGTPPEGTVHEIVWTGDRWLAVGAINEGGEGDYLTRAATWTSADGHSWEPGATIDPAPAPDPEPRSFSIYRVEVLDAQLIGIGWMFRGCCDTGKPALWRSSDALTWEFVDTTDTEYGEKSISAVDTVVGPTGEIVLVGGTDFGGTGRVLTSLDGVTWVEQPFDRERMGFAALAASDTLLMAIGSEEGAMTESRPVVLTSADGRSWSRAEPPAAKGDLADVAWDAGSGRFIVVGRDADERATAWSSEDGTSWEATALASNGFAHAIGAGGAMTTAIGHVGDDDSSEVFAWTSLDGLTWEGEPLQPGGAGSYVIGTAADRAMVYADTFDPEEDYAQVIRVWARALAR
jgi:hypothetical protein